MTASRWDAPAAFYQLLTAQGRGAVAVLRIWGPGAIELVDGIFRPNGSIRLSQSCNGRLVLGRIGEGLGDEIVAVNLQADPPVVELQCHGGTAAVALVMEALEAAGARLADIGWPAGTEAETIDPIAAAALHDLTRAATRRSAEILLDQANGALREGLTRLIRLIDEQPDEALECTHELECRAAVGLRLLSGWKVVITGRPNVGKSRLLNALAGFTRAIVDPAPGTTRDVVSLRTALGGWPVELADTAGIRPTSDAVENLGIERTRDEQRQADLALVVLDRSVPLEPIDHELIASTERSLLIANKSDLPSAWPAAPAAVLDPRTTLTISAERGYGISSLVEAIVHRLAPSPPPPGSAVPFRREQVDSIRGAKGCLLAGDARAAVRWLRSILDGK